MALTAIIGSGGKTTLLADLARQYLRAGYPVITATTTKIGAPQPGGPLHTDFVIMTDDHAPDEIAAKTAKLLRGASGKAVLLGRTQAATKIVGPAPDFLDQLHHHLIEWFPDLQILVEADGAARCPLKAHAAWEPVIPAGSDLVILCAGLDALGQKWENAVHRWDLGQRELGLPENPARIVDEADLAELLALAVGKIVMPPRLEILLNKAELADRTALAKVLDLVRARLSLPVRFGNLKNTSYQDLPHA